MAHGWYLKPWKWMRSHNGEGRDTEKLSPGLVLRYTRPLRDLVEEVELTDEPEQEWLQAVNLVGEKQSYFIITHHTALASNSQPQPPVGSEKALTNGRKEIYHKHGFPVRGERALFSF